MKEIRGMGKIFYFNYSIDYFITIYNYHSISYLTMVGTTKNAISI